jgi:hypothetical protein
VAPPARLRTVVLAAFIAAGCYPEFSFDGAGGNGGAGGDQPGTARVAVGTGGEGPTSTADASSSSAGHMTTATTTATSGGSTSSTGMTVVTQVSCGPPEITVNGWELDPCAPGQVCCFDIFLPSEDHCGSECDSNSKYTYACDGPQDCAEGHVCCANISGSSVIGIACVPSCGGSNVVLCETSDDCPSGTCQQLFGDDGYDDEYLGCQ